MKVMKISEKKTFTKAGKFPLKLGERLEIVKNSFIREMDNNGKGENI